MLNEDQQQSHHEDQKSDETNIEVSNAVLQKLKSDLRTAIDKMNEICAINNIMLKKLAVLSEDNNKLYDRNDELSDELRERTIELNELNQYGRRQNVEICNIPESIPQNALENHVIEILKSIGITNINPYNIVGVHRIGKKFNSKPRNVIVRFLNKKSAFSFLKKKKNLKSSKFKNYYVIENLCPFNKKIFNRLYKLKKENELHSVWSYNGQVFVQLEENGERIQVQHLDEIRDLFVEEESGSKYNSDGGDSSKIEEKSSFDANGSSAGDANGSTGEVASFVAGSGVEVGNGVHDNSSDLLCSILESTFNIKSRTPGRKLSIIPEEDTILRTPILPLVIKI